LILGGPARIRTGSAWALGSVAVALSVGLIRTLVTARCLEPAEIGLMGIALLALGFVDAVSSSGVDTALVAQRKDVDRFLDPAFSIQAARGIGVFAVLWLAAPAVAAALDAARTAGVIRSVGLVAIVRGFANPAVAILVRRLEFRRIFWWSLPEHLSALVITIALAIAWRDVWALVVGTLAGQMVGTLASYGMSPRIPRIVVSRTRIVDLLRFGRFVSGARALMYLSVNLDAAVVGAAMGTHALGLYQFAVRIAELPVVTFTRAIGQVALPALSGDHRDGAALARTWRPLLRSVLVVNGLAVVLVVMFGGPVIELLVGPQWLAVLPALRLLAVAMLFRTIVVLTGQLLDALHRPALTMWINAVRLGVLVLLLPVAVIYDDLQAIALAVAAANAAGALTAWRASSRVLRPAPRPA
jgi:PST family polysaccharide transporter/lipopolysaccharide exporter